MSHPKSPSFGSGQTLTKAEKIRELHEIMSLKDALQHPYKLYRDSKSLKEKTNYWLWPHEVESVFEPISLATSFAGLMLSSVMYIEFGSVLLALLFGIITLILSYVGYIGKQLDEIEFTFEVRAVEQIHHERKRLSE